MKEKIDQKKEELANIGEKPFRAEQIFKWLYQEKVKSFDEMTNLSLELRECPETPNNSLKCLIFKVSGSFSRICLSISKLSIISYYQLFVFCEYISLNIILYLCDKNVTKFI